MKKWKKSAIVFGIVLLGGILVFYGTFFVLKPPFSKAGDCNYVNYFEFTYDDASKYNETEIREKMVYNLEEAGIWQDVITWQYLGDKTHFWKSGMPDQTVHMYLPIEFVSGSIELSNIKNTLLEIEYLTNVSEPKRIAIECP